MAHYNQTPSSEAVLDPNHYDVFLNFRGKDTRLAFTDHLYQALKGEKVKTFRDEPELRSGRAIEGQLMQSLRKATTYVVVFSQNYASSRWCLDELVAINTYRKTENRSVIPVYYNIDPSVVHHQTHDFKTAFKKHGKRYDKVRLKNWRTALKEIAEISGYPVEKNTYEGEKLIEIVGRILYELDPKTLGMPYYSVGLESRLKDMTAELNRSRKAEKGVIKIVIHGMGGVGKTTLAKAFYNKNFHLFEGSSFLRDVRKASAKNRHLVRLQQQLINDVLKRKNEKIYNFDAGDPVLKRRIAKTKVLIVVDDLVEGKALEFVKGSFADGSIIIITTRNEELLESTGAQLSYKVNELDDVESLQIFSHHIFKGNKIPDKYIKWSEKILVRAGGLPLALCQFGLELARNKHDIRAWKSFLDTMERGSIDEVENELLISYNDLKKPDQKDIFLDIACFFVGREEQEVVQIMKTYYKCSIDKIENMKKKSLISIKDKDNLLRMHPLFQHMGRKLVLKHDQPEPAKTRSRLWLSKDICDVMGNNTGTEAILGIVPENQNALCSEKSYTIDTFTNMRNLRFLHIEKKNFNADLPEFKVALTTRILQSDNINQTTVLKDLRWLCWGRFPSESLPSDFFLENIEMLEFPHSEMITMWQPSKIFRNLKTLSMKCSEKLTTTPDFEKLPGLKTLNFKGCTRLEVVHPSIESLVKLVSLNLGDCVKLTNLPDIICNLKALKVLCINGCTSLTGLPEELGNIGTLEKLYAKELTVSNLPDSIGNLDKLIELILSDSKHLQTLPVTLCDLKALKLLSISGCSGLENLPSRLGNIGTLEKLYAKDLTVLDVPDSIGSLSLLVELILSDNNNLKTLPATLCDLGALEVLSIDGCSRLQVLPMELGKLKSLKVLNAFSLIVLQIPDSIMFLTELVELKLGFNNMLKQLPNTISDLTSLEKLDLTHCHQLESIPELPPNLKSIDATDCVSLAILPAGEFNLKQLEYLYVTNCRSLTEIQCSEGLTSLREIHMQGCNSSLLACTLTEGFFQTGFGHETQIFIPAGQFPDWISEGDPAGQFPELSSCPEQSSNAEGTSMSIDLSPNVSHSFLAMILRFEHSTDCNYDLTTYSIKNIRSGFKWSGSFGNPRNEEQIVIVPRSIFLVTEGDNKIEFTTNARILKIYLYRRSEIMLGNRSDTVGINLKLIIWVFVLFVFSLFICLFVF